MFLGAVIAVPPLISISGSVEAIFGRPLPADGVAPPLISISGSVEASGCLFHMSVVNSPPLISISGSVEAVRLSRQRLKVCEPSADLDQRLR